jgi:hypothetical protein
MGTSPVIDDVISFLVKFSPAFSICALLISVLSFGISLATFRRGGSRPNVWHSVCLAHYDQKSGPEFACLQIVVQNSGLASVEITNFQISRPLLGTLRNPLVVFFKGHVSLIHGATLDDFSLPGGHSKSWTYEIKFTGLNLNVPNDVRKTLRALRWTKLATSLGNRKTVCNRRFQPFSAFEDVGTYKYPGPDDPEAAIWTELSNELGRTGQFVLAKELATACRIDRDGVEDILRRWSVSGRVTHSDTRSGRGYAPAPGWSAPAGR